MTYLLINVLVTKPARKGLSIGIFLMFLNQFSGSYAIMTYTADIFKSSGSNLSPNESSIIVAFIQLLGVYCSSICVDRFGRKVSLKL
jgi:Sugar (and other) transporter